MIKTTFPVYPNTEQEVRLFEAAKRGDVSEIEALIRAGVPVDALDGRDNPWNVTALMYAAQAGHAKAVRLLLSLGAKVDAKDKGNMGYGGGRMPLHYAVSKYVKSVDVEIVKALIEAGADVNASARALPFHPLLGAVCRGSCDIVSLLIRHGTCVNVTSPSTGSTALILAAMGDSVKMIDILLAAKANVNAKDKDGDSALLAAAYGKNVEIMRRLVQAGAELRAVGANGWTLLHKAVVSENMKMIKEIVSLLPELRIVKDQEGMTALDIAVRNGFESGAKFLKSLK